jgi:hypothetical protein
LTSKNDEAGFVLVEAIAALAVAAFAATALMMALNASSARSGEARVRNLALRQAELLMTETIGADRPEDLELRGALPDSGLSWTRSLGNHGEPYPNLQPVVVEVTWKNLQKEGTTRLEAYRITQTETR